MVYLALANIKDPILVSSFILELEFGIFFSVISFPFGFSVKWLHDLKDHVSLY